MTPAETPTECEYVDIVPVPYCGTHDRPAITCLDLREKDARIRELERQRDRFADHINTDPCFAPECEICSEAKAALARSEGGSK